MYKERTQYKSSILVTKANNRKNKDVRKRYNLSIEEFIDFCNKHKIPVPSRSTIIRYETKEDKARSTTYRIYTNAIKAVEKIMDKQIQEETPLFNSDKIIKTVDKDGLKQIQDKLFELALLIENYNKVIYEYIRN